MFPRASASRPTDTYMPPSLCVQKGNNDPLPLACRYGVRVVLGVKWSPTVWIPPLAVSAWPPRH